MTSNVFEKEEKDTIERLLESVGMKKKKYYFIYNGVKFISNKEIIGVDPKTFKLIYKDNG
jgi:hypothetical protein